MLKNNQEKEIILLKDLGMQYATEFSKKKVRFGLYKCYCGNEFKTQSHDVKNLKVKSCGCGKLIITHGMGNHRLYDTWSNMKKRCCSKTFKDYKDYGGRGITICDEWMDIKVFINDMYPTFEEGLTLDRRDNNLGYSKDNCRWVSRSIQAKNTRKIRKNSTSNYRGVYFNKKNKTWHSSIMNNGCKFYFGSFNTAIEAAKAYDKFIIENSLIHTRNFS